MEKTHLFGEMDLDLTKKPNQIYKQVFYISEQCGYMPHQTGDKDSGCITIAGSDCELAKIYYHKDKVEDVKISEDSGKNWEFLNFKQNMFEPGVKTLKAYADKIMWSNVGDSLPFSQGFLINEVIKRYHIPVKRVGWHFNHIAVETKKQIILWKDQGSHAEFMGIINK